MAQKMTQESLSHFDIRLTSKDEQTLKAFQALLKLDKIEHFSSDDFRRYQLDRFIPDKQHGIGSFFGKLTKNKLAIPYGFTSSQIESNHNRTIKIYRWNNEKEVLV
jgi:hypothetical protein